MIVDDLHTHSYLSDGKCSPADIAEVACEQGRRAGLTDHCLYYGMKSEAEFHAYMRACHEAGLFAGLEIDIGRPVDLPGFVKSDVSYIIGSIHHMNRGAYDTLYSPYFRARFRGLPYQYPPELGDAAALTRTIGDSMVYHLEHDPIDILGHATILPVCAELGDESAFSDDWCARVVRAAVNHGAAIEISGHWRAPFRRFLEIAFEEGAMFSTGSDAHAKDQVCDLEYPIAMIRDLSIPEERMFSPGRLPPRIRR